MNRTSEPLQAYLWINMAKLSARAFSRYSREAALLLGQLIRLARIEKHMTVEDLAQRAGISRGLVHRIERGDLGCSIGAVFEASAIVGVRLFDAEPSTLAARISASATTITLLPQAVRSAPAQVKDDF